MLKSTKTGLFLSLAIAATSCATIHTGSHYQRVKENILARLDTRQKNVFNKAEQELPILKHLQEKQTLNAADIYYMSELTYLSRASLRYYLNPESAYARSSCNIFYRNLEGAIKSIINTDGLNISVASESRSISNLLTAIASHDKSCTRETLRASSPWSNYTLAIDALIQDEKDRIASHGKSWRRESRPGEVLL